MFRRSKETAENDNPSKAPDSILVDVLRMKAKNLHDARNRNQGFTMVELLVVTAIIALLAGLIAPSLGRAKGQVRKANEMSSARQLMVAWQLYADDHSDKVLPGYRFGFPAKDFTGNPLGDLINARYPWRLAPYLMDNFKVIYANENRALLEQFDQMTDKKLSVYFASLFPSLGINSIFVGGDEELPPIDQTFAHFGRFCVMKTSDVQHPDALNVFTSARGPSDGKIINGFYSVQPPFMLARRWSVDWNPADGPEAWGHVHPRYSNKAVCGFVDGHVKTLDRRELQDMRHWSNQADSPDWVLVGKK